jgi:hypothetical protein
MAPERIRFTFDQEVPLEDIASSLLLARWAVESLHGEPAIQLEARHTLDAARRECVIDAPTAAGHDLARVFLGYLRREFSPAQFRVEHLALEGAVLTAPAVA